MKAAVGVLLVTLASSALAAQPLADRLATASAVSFTTWRFATPLGLDSAAVSSVQQLAVPYSFRVAVGSSWSVDATGAISRTSVGLASGQGDARELTALSDVRVRAVGRVFSDRLLATFSANLPIGATGLSAEELDVLRVVAAPALQMPVAGFGTGAGGGAGMAYAWQAGSWSLATGASYEYRGAYQPVEARILGASTTADLQPGGTVRASLAADRLLGEHRFSVLMAVDVFGQDRFDVRVGGLTTRSTYTLGPMVSVAGQLEVASTHFRDARIYFSERSRLPYTGRDGAAVRGSGGSSLEVGAMGSVGRTGRPAPFGSVALHFDSGLASDPSITTAAMTMARVQVGYELPSRRSLFRPSLGLNFGRIDIGEQASAAVGVQLGLSLRGR
ncbi:MAG: hypothetical protein IPK85_05240 [Gemmatimonadetes bacterium]|nr:hypothetical protein [Gemmatimonadota bacterium]